MILLLCWLLWRILADSADTASWPEPQAVCPNGPTATVWDSRPSRLCPGRLELGTGWSLAQP
ncbi:MAG: hypothetical protein FJ280_06270 [Planctomycetes bacterium]|nr:hypothetical protein [Planctomycetota bacterium]